MVRLAYFALLAVAVTVLYRPALRGEFAFDDMSNIVHNPTVRETGFDIPSLRRAVLSPGRGAPRRPLPALTFALNYRLGGYDPFGFRLFNLLVLLASIPFAYRLASLLAGTWHRGAAAGPVAMAATLLWALHPILTNGVSYIVQRMTALSALFSLAALCFFIEALRRRRRLWYLPALFFWVLALLSKETALLVPFIAALYLWLLQERGSRRRRRLGWAIAAAVFVSQVGLLLFSVDYPAWQNRSFTLPERLLTEGRVVLRYLTLFLAPLPSRLNLDYDFAISTSFFTPLSTLPALSLHLLLVAGALRLAGRWPLLSFGVISFYLLQLLESTSLPLDIIFEHRAYLPSYFLALGLAELIFRGTRNLKPRTAAVLLPALLLGAFWGGCTYQRNRTWGSSIALWEDIVDKSPGKPRAHFGLGAVLYDAGRYEEAVAHLSKALQLDPRRQVSAIRHRLGMALSELGRHEEAYPHLLEALRLNPRSAEIHNATGSLRVRLGDLAGAREAFIEALRLDPRHAEARNNLGGVYHLQGRSEEAMEFFEEAIALDPSYARAHYNRGTVLAAGERLPEAIAAYRKAIELDPGYAGAHYNLGVALTRQERFRAAEAHFRETLRLEPEHAGARQNLDRLRSLSLRPAPSRDARRAPPDGGP